MSVAGSVVVPDDVLVAGSVVVPEEVLVAGAVVVPDDVLVAGSVVVELLEELVSLALKTTSTITSPRTTAT